MRRRVAVAFSIDVIGLYASLAGTAPTIAAEEGARRGVVGAIAPSAGRGRRASRARISTARPMAGSSAVRQLHAHFSRRRWRASIQDVTVRVLCLERVRILAGPNGQLRACRCYGDRRQQSCRDQSFQSNPSRSTCLFYVRTIGAAITAALVGLFPADVSTQRRCGKCVRQSQARGHHSCANSASSQMP